MQLKYLDNYNFICKREEILEDSIKRKKSLEYNSTIYLDKFYAENDYLYYHIKELDIKLKINGKKLKFEVIILYIFCSLILGINKKEGFVHVFNKKNLIYRFGILKNIIKDKKDLYERINFFENILKDDKQLFFYINKKIYINILFFNPYFKNKNFSTEENTFYLTSFFSEITLPIKMKKNIYNDKIEILGEIDYFELDINILKQYIEDMYNCYVEKLNFYYKLVLIVCDGKIKKICNEIILKVPNKVEIKEIITIFEKNLED